MQIQYLVIFFAMKFNSPSFVNIYIYIYINSEEVSITIINIYIYISFVLNRNSQSSIFSNIIYIYMCVYIYNGFIILKMVLENGSYPICSLNWFTKYYLIVILP